MQQILFPASIYYVRALSKDTSSFTLTGIFSINFDVCDRLKHITSLICSLICIRRAYWVDFPTDLNDASEKKRMHPKDRIICLIIANNTPCEEAPESTSLHVKMPFRGPLPSTISWKAALISGRRKQPRSNETREEKVKDESSYMLHDVSRHPQKVFALVVSM